MSNQKYDPYLQSALAHNFSGYAASSDQVSVLIELSQASSALAQFQSICTSHNATWVQAHVAAQSKFQSARGSVAWLAALAASPAVEQICLASQLKPMRVPKRQNASQYSAQTVSHSSSEVLMGVIDHGCPFAHQELRALGSSGNPVTRVLSIWDQDPSPEFKPNFATQPNDFSYGAQVDRNQLNSLMSQLSLGRNEMDLYHQLGYDSICQTLTHGTAVLSLMAGKHVSRSLKAGAWSAHPNLNLAAKAGSVSSLADISFVQLPRAALLAPSMGAMNQSILDGVRYIISQKGQQTKRIVICIPYGSVTGSHDGTSLIERALDEMIAALMTTGVQLDILFASGNSANKSLHAQVKQIATPTTHLGSGAPPSFAESVDWVIPPNLQSNTFLEIWAKPVSASASSGKITFKLNAPDSSLSLSCVLSSSTQLSSAIKLGTRVVGHAVVRFDTANQQYGIQIILFPQAGAKSNAHALAGRWKLSLEAPQKITDVVFDIYAAMGGRNIGFSQRNFPTRLIPSSPNASISQVGTTLGTACGKSPIAVGAYGIHTNFQRMNYSGGGATRGSKTKASVLAAAEESSLFVGIATMGVRSNCHTRMNGTSAAVALAARQVTNDGVLKIKMIPTLTRSTPPTSNLPANFNEPILEDTVF